AAPRRPQRRRPAAAVAQANPLRATHAAAHHKTSPPLHGAPPARGSRAKVPRPYTQSKAASASCRETCATVKPAPRRGVGPPAAVVDPHRWIPQQQSRGPCQQHEAPRPVVVTLGAMQHTYSHERQAQKRAYYGDSASERVAASA
ncbi:hypothetical protein DQ04_25651000, partial [Trypanosoma grayi]|uniref:hypothetical protein n=1 Tax=Trypanosoma grayi TaxID=71804 RepID=UPI0004F4619B